MAVDTFVLTVITILYLLATMVLGYFGYKHTREAEDYMVAGRKAHPIILALLMEPPLSALRPSYGLVVWRDNWGWVCSSSPC